VKQDDNDPDQDPLWWHCCVCGGIHYGLGRTWWGGSREHRHCDTAFERWYRGDNLDQWRNEPNRAVL
jgi:hypothetical protein